MQNTEAESKSPKISVIVPVYKVEKYLPECIESVLAQTFTDFELILVDDGSPDNSGKICDDYAQRDSRIRVFHEKNGGVSFARKLGLSHARGEWVFFLDADDMLVDRGLSMLQDFAETSGGTIIEGEIVEGRKILASRRAEDVESYLGLILGNSAVMALWGKLIKRSAIPDGAFDVPDKFKIYEDLAVNLRLFSKDQVFFKVGIPSYYYRIRGDSVSRTARVGIAYFKQLEAFLEPMLQKCSWNIRMRLRYKWLRGLLYNGVRIDRADTWIKDIWRSLSREHMRGKDVLFWIGVYCPFSTLFFRIYKRFFLK